MPKQTELDVEPADGNDATGPGRRRTLTLARVAEVVADHDREGLAVSLRSVKKETGGSQETVRLFLQELGRYKPKIESEPALSDALTRALIEGIAEHNVQIRKECQRKLDDLDNELQRRDLAKDKLRKDLLQRETIAEEVKTERDVLQGLLLSERQTHRLSQLECQRHRDDLAEANKKIAELEAQLNRLTAISDAAATQQAEETRAHEATQRALNNKQTELDHALTANAKLEGELLGLVEAKNAVDHAIYQLTKQNEALLSVTKSLTEQGKPQQSGGAALRDFDGGALDTPSEIGSAKSGAKGPTSHAARNERRHAHIADGQQRGHWDDSDGSEPHHDVPF